MRTELTSFHCVSTSDIKQFTRERNECDDDVVVFSSSSSSFSFIDEMTFDICLRNSSPIFFENNHYWYRALVVKGKMKNTEKSTLTSSVCSHHSEPKIWRNCDTMKNKANSMTIYDDDNQTTQNVSRLWRCERALLWQLFRRLNSVLICSHDDSI
jgi:hypothetical protein